MVRDLHYRPCDVQTVTTAPIFDIESTPSVGAPHGNKYRDSKKTEDKTIAPMKSVNCDCEVWLLGAEKGRWLLWLHGAEKVKSFAATWSRKVE